MKNVKRIISKMLLVFVVIVVLCFGIFGSEKENLDWNNMLTVKAEILSEQSEVVTYYVSSLGNDANVGTSLETPFQTVDYAVEMAKDGDIIVIVGSATANDITSSDAPLVINKRLTIRGERTSGELSTLSLRAGGIILGADVAFEDLNVGAESFLRPGIAANGHSLSLKNVHQDNTLRPLQIYGGTFYDYSDTIGTGRDYGASFRGEESTITIIGGSFEGIYAGSTNGSFDLPVNITICKIDPENPGVKYDFSVDNGIFSGSVVKNPQDTNTAGKIPVLDSSILLTSAVNISVRDNASVKSVSGVLEEHIVHLSTGGMGYYSYAVDCLDSVKVEGGTFALTGQFGTTESNVPDIILTGNAENKATLDISALGKIIINNFTGSEDGILVLDTRGTMTIEGSISGGITEFRTADGMPWNSAENPGYSGWIEYEYQYIWATEGDGGFVISNPYVTQEDDIDFTSESGVKNGGWVTVESLYPPPELMDFNPESVILSYEEANASVDGLRAIIIPINPVFPTDEVEELGYVPIDYQITYTDISGETTTYEEQGSIFDDNLYYYCDYKCSTVSEEREEILLRFEPIGDSIYIYAGPNGLNAGVYTIAMRATTVSDIVTKTFTLTVREKSIGESLEGYSISLDGNINVKYHFSFSEELENNVNAYAQITLPDGEKETVTLVAMKDINDGSGQPVEATKHYIDTNGYYVFTCEVAAKEMASDIRVQIFADEDTKSAVYIYSVKDYAEYLLENNNMVNGYTNEMGDLVQAMLNYGAYAQKHFKYNDISNKLANAGLEESAKAALIEEMKLVLASPEDEEYFGKDKMNLSQNLTLGTFTRANLTLESDTILNVYFKPAIEIGDLAFTVKVGNGEGAVTKEINPVKVGEEYLLQVTDIKAHRLGESCIFTITKADDETEVATLSYNAFSYCYNVIQSEDKYSDDIKNLCAALYCYSDKAVKYVNN